MHFSTGSPVIRAAAVWQRVGDCVGAQTSHASARTSAVAFIGSIVACAMNGPRYVALTVVPRTRSSAPILRTTLTLAGSRSRRSDSRNSVALSSPAFGPSSHSTFSSDFP